MIEQYVLLGNYSEVLVMKEHYRIGVDVTLDVLDGKWKSSLLCFMGTGPKRPGELRRYLPAMTPKVMTQQLKSLIDDGLIIRTDYQEKPLHVDYRLTSNGATLRRLLIEMSIWGEHQVTTWQQAGHNVSLEACDHSGFDRFTTPD